MTDNGKGTTDLFGVTLQRKAGGVWTVWNITKTQNILQGMYMFLHLDYLNQ
jgi:hypothetical protein